MSIAASLAPLGTTQPAQTLAARAAAATSAQAGAFGAQVQSWLASQSAAAGTATQSASLTEPGRATPGAGHHRRRQSSSTEANAANGISPGLSPSANATASAGGSANGATGAGTTQQSPGSLLLNDMMRGLQAYGATSRLA